MIDPISKVEEIAGCDLASTLPADGDPLQTIVPPQLYENVNAHDHFATYDSAAAQGQTPEIVAETSAICDRFAGGFSENQPPTIEDYVPAHIIGLARTVLVERLVLIELAALRKSNQRIDTTKYLSRFPNEQAALQSAFRNFDRLSGEETLLVPGLVSSGGGAAGSLAGPMSRTGSRFQLMKLHAKGGLGAVFLAKDEELGRTVALKEIQSKHALDRTCQNRFIAEAIVTGALEHPGIVPIYGLGRYPDGRPYYAMRFIKGTSFQTAIHDFYQTHPAKDVSDYYSRGFKSLLRIYIDLCSAIYFAHEHGVLHRDIKPENVMLGKFGETMVVDWGLAKVLSTVEQPTEVDHNNESLRSLSGETQLGVVMGTPAYMSPEQAFGNQNNLDARSDIYSLGATLFTVLTNERPIDGKSSIDVVLNVRNGILRSIESIAPHAPRALVSVCYKAMSKQPSNRYQSAGELIDDVERWLTDELVLAHQQQEQTLERLGRLVRRHHTWAVAAAIFLTAFAILALLAALLIDRARNRELLAKNQAQTSKIEAVQRFRQSKSAIDSWLVGSTDTLQFYPGTQAIRKRMLQLALEDYQRLAASPSRDADLELERARALIRLGEIYQLQQKYNDARTQFKAANDVLAQISQPSSIETQCIAEMANTHTRTGVAFFLEEKLIEAKVEYERSTHDLESLVEKYPEIAIAKSYLAIAYISLGELQIQLGDFESAVSTLEAALGQYKQLKNIFAATGTERLVDPNQWNDPGGRDKEVLACLVGEARGRELLGRALLEMGRYAESDQLLALTIRELRSPMLLNSDDPELADAIASASISHAAVLRTQSRQHALEAALLEAIDEYKALHRAIPDEPRFAENLALTLTDLGIAKHEHGLAVDARDVLITAQQQWQSLLLEHPDIPRLHEQAAACEDALAQVVLEATDNGSLAMEHAAIAIQTYRDLAEQVPDEPNYRHRLAIARSHAAVIQMALGNLDNSLLLITDAESILEELVTEFPQAVAYQYSLAHVLNHESEFQMKSDRQADAQANIAEAIRLWTELAESGRVDAAYELASLYLTCPITEVRDLALSLKYSKIAFEASPATPRIKAIHAIALALNHELNSASTLMAEIQTEQGEWTGRDLFALSILSRQKGDGKADEWLEKGNLWMQTNQPGSLILSRLRDLATAKGDDASFGTGR